MPRAAGFLGVPRSFQMTYKITPDSLDTASEPASVSSQTGTDQERPEHPKRREASRPGPSAGNLPASSLRASPQPTANAEDDYMKYEMASTVNFAVIT